MILSVYMQKEQWRVFSNIFKLTTIACFGLYFLWTPRIPLSEGTAVLYASLDLSSNIAALFGIIFLLLSIGFSICERVEKK